MLLRVREEKDSVQCTIDGKKLGRSKLTVFIASTMTRGVPAVTVCPASTKTWTIREANGEVQERSAKAYEEQQET